MPLFNTIGAVMAAVNVLEFTNVVTGALAPKLTCAPLTKFWPLTVSVNALLPAVTEAGDRLVMEGALMISFLEKPYISNPIACLRPSC